MSRLVRLGKGLAALGVLVGLVVGIPWALWHFVGWPLPHHVPSAAQVGRALDRQGIPAQTLVDALAVVVWLTWATLVASLSVEIPAALSGRHARRLPVAGAFQPLTGRLVATVVVACLALAPRPAHSGASSGSAGRAGLLARRPVAALVVHDATLTASATRNLVTPAFPLSPASNGSAVPTTAAPSAAASTPVTYTVQRGDTLWGIAQRELGDPLRWSEVYQLNEGRPQPGGVTLTDPHWIDPGWTLVLPTSTPPAPAAPAPAGPTAPAPVPPPAPRSAPAPSPSPTTTPSAPPPTPTTTAPAATTHPPTATVPARSHEVSSPDGVSHEQREPVRLPSGSVVAASFAAGVAATLAIGRLRRRHAYRYRPPAPGRTRATEPWRPTVAHLRRALAEREAAPEPTSGPVPAMPVDDDERRQDPGQIDIGTLRGVPVTVELVDLCGVALEGITADDVARAMLAALVVRAGPGAAEVLCDDTVAERLFPGLPAHRTLRRAASADQVARAVESERVARIRRFDAVGAADAEQFRRENPENPLPLLFVVLDEVPAESLGRWAALLADAARLAITVCFLAPTPIATGTLRLDATRMVTDAEPAGRLGALAGVGLFGLRAEEVVEVLAAVMEATDEGDLDEEDEAASPAAPDGAADEPWPEPGPPLPAVADGGEERPVVVRVFGHLEVAVSGQPVVTGLRSRGRDLFAWFMLRPEGATSDEAVDVLWPDTAPGRVHGQFWRSFSDLRGRLRELAGRELEVLTKAGEHYRPAASEIACDLWGFQAALREASATDDPEQARAALRRAVGLYRGDLLAGADRPWIEPARQDLHRRALDAHLRLAELEERAGHTESAVEFLERAIDADRYAEEPYRRLMTLHAAHDRTGALRDVWRLLQGRLAELDLDVEPATADLYRQLTAPDTRPVGHDRVRSAR